MNRRYLGCLWLGVWLVTVANIALAEEGGAGDVGPYATGFDFSDTRFSLGIGLAALRYDAQLNFIDKDSGDSIFVDAEGTLGLPETDVSPLLFGRYRFSPRHSLGFSFWNLRRSNTLIDGDIDLGDLEISGQVGLSDRSNFYYLSYNYTFLQDARSKVFGTVGLYGLDVRYQLEATGTISIDGTPIAGDMLVRDVSVSAPLPMVGVDAIFALTPKWSLGTKVTFVAGSVGKVRNALVLDTSVRAQYMFNDSFGLHVGMKYFNADFEVNQSALRTEVSYGFDGIFGGLSLTF
ncbi:MAG: hypothetical protein AAGE43_06635 [Pseudomonadota bacterium]